MVTSFSASHVAGKSINIKAGRGVKTDYVPFRDRMIAELNPLHGDLDAALKCLEALCNDKEGRNLHNIIIEILILGNLLGSNGSVMDDTKLKISLFNCNEDVLEIQNFVGNILAKLTKKFKSLASHMTEVIDKFLHYIGRWPSHQMTLLSMGCGVMAAQEILPMSVFEHALLSDNLTREGWSLQCMTIVLRTFLQVSTLNVLDIQLRRAGLDHRLLEFFPPNKRDAESLSRYFSAENLEELTEYFKKKRISSMMEELAESLISMIEKEEDSASIIDFAQQAAVSNHINEDDMALLIWRVLIRVSQYKSRTESLDQTLYRALITWCEILEAFCTKAKSQLSLLYAVQSECYELVELMQSFSRYVLKLIEMDVIAQETAIHWYKNGSNQKGRAVFLKQMENIVQRLQDEDDEDE